MAAPAFGTSVPLKILTPCSYEEVRVVVFGIALNGPVELEIHRFDGDAVLEFVPVGSFSRCVCFHLFDGALVAVLVNDREHDAVSRGDREHVVPVLEFRRAAINRRDDDRAEVLDLLGVRREVCFVIVPLRLPARGRGLGLGLHSRGRHDKCCLLSLITVGKRVDSRLRGGWSLRSTSRRRLDGVVSCRVLRGSRARQSRIYERLGPEPSRGSAKTGRARSPTRIRIDATHRTNNT